MIWVYVIGGVVLLVAGFLAYLFIEDAMKEKFVRENGRPVLGTLAMANETLYDPDGDPATTAFALISFDEPTLALLDELVELGERLNELYTSVPDSVNQTPVEQKFAASLKQHNYTENRRRLVPRELTGGRTVYIVDLYVKRDRLPPDWQAHRTLACMATGKDEGRVILLKLDEQEAVAMYEKLGVDLE